MQAMIRYLFGQIVSFQSEKSDCIFFGGSLSFGKEKVLKHILRKRFTQDEIEGPSKFIFQNYEKFLFILLVSIFSIFMHYYKRMDHDSAMYLIPLE